MRSSSASRQDDAGLNAIVWHALSQIGGLGPCFTLKLVAECGTDLRARPSSKTFRLDMAPGNKISGGKVVSSRIRRSSSRAAALCDGPLSQSAIVIAHLVPFIASQRGQADPKTNKTDRKDAFDLARLVCGGWYEPTMIHQIRGFFKTFGLTLSVLVAHFCFAVQMTSGVFVLKHYFSHKDGV